MISLLIPVAKGLLGLMGVSSLMFFNIKQEVAMEVREIEAEVQKLEAKRLLLEEMKPLQPLPVEPKEEE